MKRFICNCLGVFSLCWITLIVAHPTINNINIPADDYEIVISVSGGETPPPVIIAELGKEIDITGRDSVNIKFKVSKEESLAEVIRMLQVLTNSEASEASGK